MRLAVGERAGTVEFAEIVQIRISAADVPGVVHGSVALGVAPLRVALVEGRVATFKDIYLGEEDPRIVSRVDLAIPLSKVLGAWGYCQLMYRDKGAYHSQGRGTLGTELAVEDEHDLVALLLTTSARKWQGALRGMNA